MSKVNPEQEALRLSTERKVIPLKKQRSKRTRTPAEYSNEAVTRAAGFLTDLGFSEAEAYKSLAIQLHMNLVELKGGGK